MNVMPPHRGAALLLAVLALAACGDDSRPPAAVEIAPADLAIMVLPEEQLGGLADGLRLSAGDSGPASSAKAARQTLDPKDTGRSLAGQGYLRGYNLTFSDSRLLAAKRKTGVLVVGSSVDLLDDGASASRFLNTQMGDFERLRKRLPGVRITGITAFDVPRVGHEAHGLRARMRAAGLDVRLTMVAFRRGRLLGSIAVNRVGPGSDVRALRRLALTLDSRIQLVLGGGLDDEPVPIPGKRAKVDPKPLTVGLADLPPGLTVVGEGYRRPGGVRSFIREFRFHENRFTRSTIHRFRAMTQVLDSEDAAVVSLRYLRTPAGSRHFHRLAATGAFGARPEGLEVRPLEAGGPEAYASISTFTTRKSKGRQAIVLLYVRSGVSLGSLTAIGPAAELEPNDVLALEPALHARLASGS